MSGKYGTSNAGSRICWGCRIVTRYHKERGGYEAEMSISVDDCIDLAGLARAFLLNEDVFGLDLLGLPIGHIGLPEVYKKLGRSVGNRSVFTDMASDGPICLMGREKVFRSYAGEIFSSYQVPVRSWRYSQGECGNVTTDAMRRLRSSLLLIKTPSCASIYTPCGNDLNIVLRSVLRGLIILVL
ncbi:hypothetical protein Tco_0640400 [Tanacetum coccineum]